MSGEHYGQNAEPQPEPKLEQKIFVQIPAGLLGSMRLPKY
jgi:hypothetical protein